MQDLLVEIEDLRSKVKTKDERMCISETQLEQDRSKSVLVRANLNRAKMNLAEEIAQCKLLEMKVNQKSNDLKALQKELESEQLKGTQSNEKAKEKYLLEQEIGCMKEQHRRHMDAIQTLWRERENRREEDEAHSSVLVPLEEQISQMKEGFDEERETLLMKLEESYDLHTGRDRKVCSTIGMQNHYIKSGLCSLLTFRSLWVHQGREAMQLQRNVWLIIMSLKYLLK